jgi:hypothetical protein
METTSTGWWRRDFAPGAGNIGGWCPWLSRAALSADAQIVLLLPEVERKISRRG